MLLLKIVNVNIHRKILHKLSKPKNIFLFSSMSGKKVIKTYKISLAFYFDLYIKASINLIIKAKNCKNNVKKENNCKILLTLIPKYGSIKL